MTTHTITRWMASLALILMHARTYADEVRMESFSPEGELTWSNAQGTAYCRVEFARSLGRPWLGALSGPWRTFEQTNAIQSVVVPIETGYYATSTPPVSVDGDSVFFRIVSFEASQGPQDRISRPSTNSVVVFNASTNAVTDIWLSMVGATNMAHQAYLGPWQASSVFLFHLPKLPDSFPFSWSDYSGNYTHGDEKPNGEQKVFQSL